MVLTRRQQANIMAQFEYLFINQKLNIMVNPVNYVVSPFEGNIGTGDPQGLKIYLQETR